MDPRESMTWRGIPVTTVARTLVDLAGILSLDALARACHEAGVQHGATPAAVDAVLARHRGTPGAGRLRRVLHGEVRVTLSVMEVGSRNKLAMPRQRKKLCSRLNRYVITSCGRANQKAWRTCWPRSWRYSKQ